jgi:hypothetical protein
MLRDRCAQNDSQVYFERIRRAPAQHARGVRAAAD